MLLKSNALQEQFFEWALRDRNPVGIFVEYPAIQQKLTDNLLQTRIGRLGGQALNIKKVNLQGKENIKEKVVTLLFEGKPISILDENQEIIFKGNYRLTLREVFNIFHNKESEVGNLEFFHEGIVNWNTHRLGSWNADKGEYERIDLQQANWWKNFHTLRP